MTDLGPKDGVIGLLTILLTGGSAKALVDTVREIRRDRAAARSPEAMQKGLDASVLTMARTQDRLELENARLQKERDYWQEQYQEAEERRTRDVAAADDRRRVLEAELRGEMRTLREYAERLEVRQREQLADNLRLQQRVAEVEAALSRRTEGTG